MTGVAAVIGNYQGERVLGDCLRSLREQTLPPVEVVVVDGGSTDRSDAIAADHGARFLRVPNRGLGFLYNRGAEAVAAPYALLTNNDVAFDPRCLELLAAALDADASRFAADPRQVGWDDGRLVHGLARLRRGPLLRELLPGHRLELTEPADAPTPTITANAGAMLVRRDRLLELGGFDETFFLDFEDLDLCWRAWLRGWESVYVPDAWLRHHVGASHGGRRRALRSRYAQSHHNLLRFALKCLPATGAARVVAGELLRLPRHPLLVAPALLRVARELGEIRRERARIRPTRELYDWALRA